MPKDISEEKDSMVSLVIVICSFEGVDKQVLRREIPHDELVAGDTPQGNPNIRIRVEKLMLTSERCTSNEERHDCVRVGSPH